VIAHHLLRHGHAGDPARWHGNDAERPLSDKGRRQSERLGRLLASAPEPPDLFITSPKARAAQTAEIVAGILGARVVVDDRLAGPIDAAVVGRILADAGHCERPCLVGHDPDFTDLLAELLGTGSIPMRKGAIARVDLPEGRAEPGAGTLRYLLPPDLLPPA
jgi:phosphohistidine phosphatase